MGLPECSQVFNHLSHNLCPLAVVDGTIVFDVASVAVLAVVVDDVDVGGDLCRR